MKIAHVRERHGPVGAPWRLAGSADPAETPSRWLDLERARRRLAGRDERLVHNDPLFRQPITTLDELFMRGIRVERLRPLVESWEPDDEDDEALLETGDLAFGPPVLRPPTIRDFYAFERHVRTMWERRGDRVPEAWYRLPIFYFSNPSEIRGPDEAVSAPRGSRELDFELEVAAVVDTSARDLPADRAEEAIGGYTIFNDWSARDLQREETTVRLGPAKGKDFASTFGPWLVTPEELADRRSGKGYHLSMTASIRMADGTIVEVSRGRWADAQFSFGEMLARASADVRVRPGDLLGSGTVGSGCLLEVREATLGRYLEPGDEVLLQVERLGELRTPVVERTG